MRELDGRYYAVGDNEYSVVDIYNGHIESVGAPKRLSAGIEWFIEQAERNPGCKGIFPASERIERTLWARDWHIGAWGNDGIDAGPFAYVPPRRDRVIPIDYLISPRNLILVRPVTISSHR